MFRRTEQGLLKELEIAQEQQRRQDERVFRAVSLVAAIVYMLAQSRFDVAGGGVYSLYRWMLRTLRYADIYKYWSYCSDPPLFPLLFAAGSRASFYLATPAAQSLPLREWYRLLPLPPLSLLL